MGQLNFIEIGYKLGIFFVPFLFALCFHEFAHGLVAKWKGDRTAEMEGRLTLNPMAHADPIGTWVLPIVSIVFGFPFFFGWARPVPVNTRNLKGRHDMFWISLAGPLSNIFLALVSTVLIGMAHAYLHGPSTNGIQQLLQTFLLTNLFLAVFNLIPIHPLDGGKIIEPFLPREWNLWLMENQAQLNMFLFLFIMVAGNILAVPVLWSAHQLIQVASFIAQNLV